MELSISNALEAIQSFGLSPDNAEVIIHDWCGYPPMEILRIGEWYADDIMPYLEKEATSINISIGQEETKIMAVFK